LLTHRQTDKVWQKHYLLGGGEKTALEAFIFLYTPSPVYESF